MTMINHSAMNQTVTAGRPRYFPSGLALVAAAELILIAVLLRVSNTQGFYPAAIACSLCSIQLGILLINRFSVNTRSIRRLARTAEFSSQATFITDPQGRIKWANPRFTRMTGFALSDLSGKTFSMVLHGQETDTRAVEKIRERMRLELPFEAEILEYDRAGLSLWVCSKGQPIGDSRGVVTHYLVTQQDVTEERRQSQMIIDALTKTPAADPQALARTQVAELTRHLDSLSSTDDRGQLQMAIDHLKSGIEKCMAVVPDHQDHPQSKRPGEVNFDEQNFMTPGEPPRKNDE